MKAFNKVDFNKAVSTVVRSGQTVAERLQDVIEMGFSYYAEHGDATYLSKAVETAQKARSVKAEDVKRYITQHANVKWISDDNGTRFVKRKKSQAVAVTEPTQKWYEATEQDKVQPEVSLDKAKKTLLSLLAKIEKGFEEDKIKEGDEADLLALSNQVKTLVA